MKKPDWIRIKLDYCIGYTDDGIDVIYPTYHELAIRHNIPYGTLKTHVVVDSQRGRSWSKERAMQQLKLYDLVSEQVLLELARIISLPVVDDSTGLNFKALTEDEVKEFRRCSNIMARLREKMEAAKS